MSFLPVFLAVWNRYFQVEARNRRLIRPASAPTTGVSHQRRTLMLGKIFLISGIQTLY